MIIQKILAANASLYIQNKRNQKTETMINNKIVYVALDCDGDRPIVAAENFTSLKAGLDEYYGTERSDAECLGYFPDDSEFPDEYQGHFQYRSTYPTGPEVDRIKVYCLDIFTLKSE